MQRRFFRGAAVVFGLLFVNAAFAQTYVDALPPDNFYEEFDEVPNVSGGQLLGLRLEGGSKWPSVTSPIFLKPPSDTSAICIRVATQDGRYRASNPFVVPEADELANIRLATLTRSYLTILSRYVTDEIAVRAYVPEQPDCSAQSAINLPFVSEIGADLNTLVLYVNSGGLDVRASLFLSEAEEAMGGVPIASAVCKGLGTSGRIAYNNQCRIELDAAPARVALLRIDFDDGFSESYLRALVALPEIVSK
ncbi:hypothetical protein [Devosia sp. CAU 1758]